MPADTPHSGRPGLAGQRPEPGADEAGAHAGAPDISEVNEGDGNNGEAPGTARRRRGPALEHSILEAAWDELSEVGYPRLTMEGVAARAHTGKQVLYRRWPSRAELVVAAIREHTGSILDVVPDTGSLRGDMLAVLHRMIERQREIGSDAFHGLMAELPALAPQLFTILGGAMREILRRAAARGEIGPGPVPARVATVAVDLLRHQLQLTAQHPVSEQVVHEILDEVFLPLVHVHADAPAPAPARGRN